MRWDGAEDYYLPFDNETYTAYTGTNVDFDTELLRYGYNSLTTPSSVIEFNMRTKIKTVLKEQEVLGGKFNKDNYTSERIWATANDGTKLVCNKMTRYKESMETMYSHSTITFNYEGKTYTVRFQK